MMSNDIILTFFACWNESDLPAKKHILLQIQITHSDRTALFSSSLCSGAVLSKYLVLFFFFLSFFFFFFAAILISTNSNPQIFISNQNYIDLGSLNAKLCSLLSK